MYNNDNGNRFSEVASIIMAIIAFVFIAIVIVRNNVTGDWTNKTFSANSYYEVEQVSEKGINEVSQWNNIMNKDTGYHCPQVNMTNTRKGRMMLTSQGNKYKHDVWILNSEETTGTSGGIAIITRTNESNAEDIVRKSLYLDSADASIWDNNSKEGTPIYGYYSDLYGLEYMEIIAPFFFNFGNINTNEDKDIVIYSNTGKLRITWIGAANWYCAGYPNSIENWIEHGTNNSSRTNENRHKTIIGNTANASVSGGNAGDIIGYANSDTRVLIEALQGGIWTPISIREWIMDTN